MIATTTTGKVRAICNQCSRRSAPVQPSRRGEASIFDLAVGWSVAPYPDGDMYWCPSCNAVRRRA